MKNAVLVLAEILVSFNCAFAGSSGDSAEESFTINVESAKVTKNPNRYIAQGVISDQESGAAGGFKVAVVLDSRTCKHAEVRH